MSGTGRRPFGRGARSALVLFVMGVVAVLGCLGDPKAGVAARAFAQGPPAPASTASVSTRDQIAAAISVVIAVDPAAGQALSDAFVASPSRLRVAATPGDSDGWTGPSRVAGKSQKRIHVTPKKGRLFGTDPKFHCTCEFVRLTAVLLHEEKHLEQPAETAAITSPVTVERKRERASSELAAYRRTEEMYKAWAKAIDDFVTTGKPPKGFEFLEDCLGPNDDPAPLLKLLEDCINKERWKMGPDGPGGLQELLRLLGLVDTKQLNTADEIDANPMLRGALGLVTSGTQEPRTVELLGMNSTRSSIMRFDEDTRHYSQITLPPGFLPTGILSLKGNEAFLVCGTDSYERPTRGTVLLFASTGRDGCYDRSVVLLDAAALKLPRNLTIHRGRPFVYDAALRKLFEILDTDRDGLPDAVAGTSALEVPANAETDAGFPSFPIDEVHSIDDRFVGGSGAPTVVFVPDSTEARWAETGGQLVYVGYKQWWQWDDVEPFAVHPLFRGLREVRVRGAIGHAVELTETNRKGQELVLGTATMGTDGTGTISLSVPIKHGQTFSLRDVTTGLVTTGIPSEQPRPYVLDIQPGTLEGLSGGVPISLSGLFLDHVHGVSVGGVPAQIVARSGEQLVLIAPAVNTDGVHDIVLTEAKRVLPAGGLRYRFPSFPRLVLRRPTTEDRFDVIEGSSRTLVIEAYVGRGGGPTPIPGQRVDVLDQTGTTIATGTTDANGLATFTLSLDATSPVRLRVRATVATPPAVLEETVGLR